MRAVERNPPVVDPCIDRPARSEPPPRQRVPSGSCAAPARAGPGSPPGPRPLPLPRFGPPWPIRCPRARPRSSRAVRRSRGAARQGRASTPAVRSPSPSRASSPSSAPAAGIQPGSTPARTTDCHRIRHDAPTEASGVLVSSVRSRRQPETVKRPGASRSSAARKTGRSASCRISRSIDMSVARTSIEPVRSTTYGGAEPGGGRRGPPPPPRSVPLRPSARAAPRRFDRPRPGGDTGGRTGAVSAALRQAPGDGPRASASRASAVFIRSAMRFSCHQATAVAAPLARGGRGAYRQREPQTAPTDLNRPDTSSIILSAKPASGR